jgi:CHAD domain-containing protein
VGDIATVDEPRTDELVATYYDTADLRLAREGITLRRRTGGDDAGWTLKLPLGRGGDAGREEVSAPLGRSKTPPPDLRDLVTARVRGEELAPVGELRTTRVTRVLRDTEGTALAELVDDSVTARGVGNGDSRPTVFREVEVELVGDAGLTVLDAVGDALCAAGAVAEEFQPKLVRALGARALEPPSPPRPTTQISTTRPAGDLLTSYLREQVRALITQDARMRRELEDSVHKARVATRRLRSALKNFAPLIDAEAVEGLRDELKWLANELAPARDSEVVLVRLRALVQSQPPELLLGPVAARVDERLLGDLVRGTEQALAALRSKRYVALLDRLVELATRPPLTELASEPVGEVVPGLVAKSYKRLAKRLRGLDDLDDEQLHDARKAGKRARYAGEAVVITYGDDAAGFAAAMEEMQDVLGEHQDAVVARDLLGDLGLSAYQAGENAWSFGWLAGREQAAADASRDELGAVWKEARRGRHRRWLKD